MKLFQQFSHLKKKPYWGNHFWAKGFYVDTVGLDADMTHQYRISLDFGVCQNPEEFEGRGRLTCCNVLTREIWQV
ncbi:MAG: hypothetical protein A2X82_02345 [Geobacteraceae bacterium GWC2_55_20]|nr:MAG: hypothetical protein A2X82_02345 [Geobacteraceae bacterium GWC2_55_20]OGU20236.1 MAG: hypothetical protein A2X85_06795 [Geobacteraceae bacterium GWF2_54_21]